jgi:hypothetical protein
VVVPKINLTGMNCVVPDYPQDVHRLLNPPGHSPLNQRGNRVVDLLAPLPELVADLLQSEPKKGCRPSR